LASATQVECCAVTKMGIYSPFGSILGAGKEGGMGDWVIGCLSETGSDGRVLDG
jgi:hypothetical protein